MELESNRELLHFFDLREGYRLVTSYVHFDERRCIEQRVWFLTDQGTWAPTRKGFTIAEKHKTSLAKSAAALLGTE